MSNQPPASVKQQREARRAEKVAALKVQQAKQKRNRLIGIISSIAGAIVVIGLVVTFVVISATPKVDPASINIAGLKNFGTLPQVHVDGDADATNDTVDYKALYDMDPPAGGDHWGVWLNCGIYTEVQEPSRAVHALEHGAVWVTYDPTKITGDALKKLQDEVPSTYSILSPYPNLPAPVVISAWANQVQLDGVDDPRLGQFVSKFWKSAKAPEPGAACTGGIDGPGQL